LWHSYIGQSEGEVVAAIGTPGYNERVHNRGYVAGETYLAWWPYSVGGRFCIEFDANGKAVAQYRNDK
jgi:hypothetical protein